MNDDVYRLWKITVRSLRKVEQLSCSVYSKEVNYQLAVKKKKQSHKKKRENEYACTDKVLKRRKRIFNSETSRYKQAEAKYKRDKNNLDNYLFDVAELPDEYRDNFCVEFDGRRNQISIFFGGKYDKPKGINHGHCVLDAFTLRQRCPIRYPGDPHPVKEKKKKYHEDFGELEESLGFTYA